MNGLFSVEAYVRALVYSESQNRKKREERQAESAAGLRKGHEEKAEKDAEAQKHEERGLKAA